MSRTLLIVSLTVAALVVLVAAADLTLNASAPTLVVKSRRTPENLPPKWRIRGAASPSHSLTFELALKFRNTEELERIFWDVSNPKSINYGKYLSKSDVEALTAPHESSFVAVERWLSSHGISHTSMERRLSSGSVRVQATVAEVERLFSTSMVTVRHSGTGATVVRHIGDLSIPADLEEHVELVLGLSELVSSTRHVAAKGPVTDEDLIITPDVLRSFYKVPSSLVGTNRNNTQSIAAFSDYFSQGALTQFQVKYNLARQQIIKTGPDCLPNCDEGESDLDIQYVTAMGRNVTTSFANHPSGYWILQWTSELINSDRPPYVNSVSYGWSEFGQCQIATVQCSALGYNSEQYVRRVDQTFQMLGTRGVTVLVSDGDDGAPSLGGADGNCPIDTARYCPLGGCQYTTSKCPMLTFTTNQASDGNCYFPMGLGSDACSTVLQNNDAVNSALNAFIEKNSHCAVNLDQDKRQNYHVYSKCACSELKSASSDDNSVHIKAYSYSPDGGRALNPDFPTSSSYVVSVGATQFLNKNGQITDEVAASITTGAIITTGGGFSAINAQPPHQADVVRQYLSSGVPLPPNNMYDSSLRGYPDISFNGHHYDIFISQSSNDNCPCKDIAVDGTSCSSPALAGLISLLNDYLLNHNRPVLGYVSPLLYQMAKDHPAAFNDITSGDNKCNRAYCCTAGFVASPGWDPVTGLGTPNFTEILNYLSTMQPQQK